MKFILKQLEWIKSTIFIIPLIYLKRLFVEPASQSNEALIVNELVKKFNISNTFIEFGFSGWEFNTISLAKSWRGLLLDTDKYNIRIANVLWKNNITAVHKWLTLDNLGLFKDWLSKDSLGILSIDVDGNDFWFLEALIDLNPEMLICEYNPVYQLRPITAVYDQSFDRTKKHPDWIYYGVSIAALHRFLTHHNYSLVRTSTNCVNSFFIRNDLIKDGDEILQPEISFCNYAWNNSESTEDQWQKIKSMDFMEINEDGTSKEFIN